MTGGLRSDTSPVLEVRAEAEGLSASALLNVCYAP